jgi:hypothetical protein
MGQCAFHVIAEPAAVRIGAMKSPASEAESELLSQVAGRVRVAHHA